MKRDYESYSLTFEYWDRRYAWRVILEGVKLFFAGRCTLTVNMAMPRDMAMLAGAEAAGKKFNMECANSAKESK